MRLHLSRRAQIDLVEIADYIARDNPERAASFIDEILEHCRGLIAFPRAARLRPEVGDGVRIATFHRYLVIYVVGSEALEIRRIVHGARNLFDLDIGR
jgi:toxin ParE1/3/4